jgi:hypothetical protein
MLVLDDGSLCVSDEANRTDYLFGPDGGFIRSFAPRGQGPGEVQRHGRFFSAGGKVIVPDIGRIHYFTREGRYLRTVNKECEPHAFVDEHKLIDAPLSALFLPEGKGKIALSDLQSGIDAVIAEFSAFEGGVARSGEMVADIIVPAFSPLMTIGYADDRLYWGMSDRYLIHVADLEGQGITSFSVDRRKARISKREKEAYCNKGGLPADMLKQIVDGLPDEVTVFHRVEVHNRLIFVFITDIDLENRILRARQIDIFSPEGRYLYRAPLNFGKNRIHLYSPLQNLVIAKDFLYAVLQDEKDNVRIAKYRISLPAL